MVGKRDMGRMEEYFISKDIELLMVNRIKNKLEYIERCAKELNKEIQLLRIELRELDVDF